MGWHSGWKEPATGSLCICCEIYTGRRKQQRAKRHSITDTLIIIAKVSIISSKLLFFGIAKPKNNSHESI
jgi:hypothetical protein